MVTVWGRMTSSNVQAVMWRIAELGLDYVRHDVGHRFGGLDTSDFHLLNPNRTVPVIQDAEGPAIWESGAILRYMASKYGNAASGQPASRNTQQLTSGRNGQKSMLRFSLPALFSGGL